MLIISPLLAALGNLASFEHCRFCGSLIVLHYSTLVLNLLVSLTRQVLLQFLRATSVFLNPILEYSDFSSRPNRMLLVLSDFLEIFPRVEVFDTFDFFPDFGVRTFELPSHVCDLGFDRFSITTWNVVA